MELGDFFLDKPEKIRYTREAVKGKALIGGSPVKLEELELSLLFDYYGELLTEKQRTCFELYYNQDFSLGEIAGEAGISRQGGVRHLGPGGERPADHGGKSRRGGPGFGLPEGAGPHSSGGRDLGPE